ncbi:MAG: hypothetical protein IJ710_10280 [Prevotella sp.]|nr:hypothetical protein [Prevotella sp.]
MRHLTDSFFDELKNDDGRFHEILEIVRWDDTLDLELRGDYCTIYYRGGRLLSFTEDGKLSGIDRKYLKPDEEPMEAKLSNVSAYMAWAKQKIDYYVSQERNHLGEKEIQQLIVRENNYSSNAPDTDFFIVDMEYQDGSDKRFDLVALRWDSTSSARRTGKVKLYVIEVKQGFGAVRTISGSGLKKHLEDFKRFSKDTKDFKEDMIKVFQQKFDLELLRDVDNLKEKVKQLKVEEDVEFACIMANYKPTSKELLNELEEISDCQFFTSSLMGYGLYSKFLVGKDTVIKLLK